MKRQFLTMTFAAALVSGLVGAASAPAQDQDQQALIRKRDEKLAKPFVAAGGWSTDYDQARAQAKGQNKPIFVYFTRSYAH